MKKSRESYQNFFLILWLI